MYQAPSGEDKGFTINGEKLDLIRKATGNHLKVISDGNNLADLHMDPLVVVGPEIEIDQGDNTATVDGDGYMQMENTTDFQGNPLKKPELLTVHWNKLMRFEGSFAEFLGNIEAAAGLVAAAMPDDAGLFRQAGLPQRPAAVREEATAPGEEPAKVKTARSATAVSRSRKRFTKSAIGSPTPR